MSTFSNLTTTTTIAPYIPTSRPVQFSILLTIAIFSVPCSIFVLHHFLSTKTLYRAANNHVIILLLISNCLQTLTDVPGQLSYYILGVNRPLTLSYCYYFYFIDFYLFTTCFLLLTWSSFERHILIFHTYVFNTHRKRVAYHYTPLMICVTYPMIYYVYFIFFYPCENYYDEYTSYCVPACYLRTNAVMALYEQIAHGFALMLLIFIFNVLLFIRVVQQKTRMGRQMTWKKNRKMAVQLFSMCFLFLLTNGGYFVVQIGQMLYDPTFGVDFSLWAIPVAMCMPPLFPFVCLSTLDELHGKVRKAISCCNRFAVVPIIGTELQHLPTTTSRRRDF
ncbi:unnamed protein product [Adineta ricciae]|uniref:G-protein coupled receptors family 1 profile domain-containing protein n=1 Tax=Adineta ricciae TaxID=249248 RepID=A0A815KFS1_ADIRI|nr:unnamed protein product [Adineta ricciae]CAF1392716.1 unnamed protein product [Adineta ricciae]